MHFVQWYRPKIITDSFTTWRTAFIKQVRYSTHRTLHETFGARHPSSVSPLGCQLPPGGSQGGPLRIRPRFLKTAGAYRNPSAAAAAAPLSGALFSLPPLGEVPRSGKGGAVGSFELLPFNGRHPLSQPLRAASSPIGEPRNCAYSPKVS